MFTITGASKTKSKRNKASDKQEQAADDLEYGNDVKIMAQEKRLGEVSSQRRRWRWHGNKMQEDVRTEHNEGQPEKNPCDSGSNFHFVMVADRLKIPTSNF